MGRQQDMKMVGTIGNVIFYNRLGEYCMRSKPGSVRRTKPSVHAGLNFGKASRISKKIRNLVEPINLCKSNSLQRNRLNGSLHKFISWKEKMELNHIKMPDNLPFIQEFQFNEEANLSSMGSIQVSLNTKGSDGCTLELAPFIPGRELFAPAITDHILFKTKLLRINLSDTETTLLTSSEIEIPFSNTVYQTPPVPIPAVLNPGDLFMMVLAIQYIVNRKGELKMLNESRKLPCGIVWTCFY